jgi:hypothetical protein
VVTDIVCVENATAIIQGVDAFFNEAKGQRNIAGDGYVAFSSEVGDAVIGGTCFEGANFHHKQALFDEYMVRIFKRDRTVCGKNQGYLFPSGTFLDDFADGRGTGVRVNKKFHGDLRLAT